MLCSTCTVQIQPGERVTLQIIMQIVRLPLGDVSYRSYVQIRNISSPGQTERSKSSRRNRLSVKGAELLGLKLIQRKSESDILEKRQTVFDASRKIARDNSTQAGESGYTRLGKC